MSYRTQAILAHDEKLLTRITACASREGEQSPQRWAYENQWKFSAQPGWDDAYAYAIDTGVEHPGDDEGVITDAQILAAVQAIRLPAGTASAST